MIPMEELEGKYSRKRRDCSPEMGGRPFLCWLHHAYAVLGALRARSEAKRNRLARHLPRAERFVFFWYLLGLAAPRRHRRAPVVS